MHPSVHGQEIITKTHTLHIPTYAKSKQRIIGVIYKVFKKADCHTLEAGGTPNLSLSSLYIKLS